MKGGKKKPSKITTSKTEKTTHCDSIVTKTCYLTNMVNYIFLTNKMQLCLNWIGLILILGIWKIANHMWTM